MSNDPDRPELDPGPSQTPTNPADAQPQSAPGAGAWRDGADPGLPLEDGGAAAQTLVPAGQHANADEAEIPASLELDFGPADLGLSHRASEHEISYDRVRRRRKSAHTRKIARELVETVILALLIFFAVRGLVQNFRVEGESMEPSMHNNQYLLVNKAIYFRVNLGRLDDWLPFLPGDGNGKDHLFRPPNRGDVIVFRFHLDPDRDFIKRVIGVPGDTIEVKDGTVFVNGSPLKEEYILAAPNYTYGPKTVPEGMYFVLGDNRRNSFDSHAWGSSCSPEEQCDFVPEENIIGQAWLSYWPFDELGFINNKDLKPQAP
jgi:signal peptidase I